MFSIIILIENIKQLYHCEAKPKGIYPLPHPCVGTWRWMKPKYGFQFATQNAEKQMEVMDHATHIAPFSPAPLNHPLHF